MMADFLTKPISKVILVRLLKAFDLMGNSGQEDKNYGGVLNLHA